MQMLKWFMQHLLNPSLISLETPPRNPLIQLGTPTPKLHRALNSPSRLRQPARPRSLPNQQLVTDPRPKRMITLDPYGQ